MLKLRGVEVGAAIAALMSTRDISQSDMAEALGVTPSSVSRILSGKQSANSTQLATIADRLDVEAGLLYRIARLVQPGWRPEDDEHYLRLERRTSELVRRSLGDGGDGGEVDRDEFRSLQEEVRELATLIGRLLTERGAPL
jgi:transcriptional regulator with XRE-family HTH domain